MRRKSLCAGMVAAALALWWLCGSPAGRMAVAAEQSATASTVVKLSVPSRHTGIAMPVLVYLPAGYDAGVAYPVWYGLHGYSTTQSMWLTHAGIGDAADALIAQGSLRPLMMVFPLTRYDSAKTIRADMADGERGASQMERFVCEELVPYIDAHYATQAAPEGRFIGGFSMGGLFALQIGLHHPALFGKIGAYSPALTKDDFGGAAFDVWLNYDNPTPAADVRDYARTHGLAGLQIDLDCGAAGDPFAAGAASLAQALQARGVAVRFAQHGGGHTLQADRLAGYLLFYAGRE